MNPLLFALLAASARDPDLARDPFIGVDHRSLAIFDAGGAVREHLGYRDLLGECVVARLPYVDMGGYVPSPAADEARVAKAHTKRARKAARRLAGVGS